ncbi:hypothetical protein BU16DRAFT_566090 [Lophium mytilinum]|uniref:Uncharacterized protein n=1 Tax=Lophium mytilinum TaxID=390894 RepID=A0A6A6QI88_9PEZI|nr:hypothetical protein BU16DRAFT_566090 [Lophium mytilinum]
MSSDNIKTLKASFHSFPKTQTTRITTNTEKRAKFEAEIAEIDARMEQRNIDYEKKIADIEARYPSNNAEERRETDTFLARLREDPRPAHTTSQQSTRRQPGHSTSRQLQQSTHRQSQSTRTAAPSSARGMRDTFLNGVGRATGGSNGTSSHSQGERTGNASSCNGGSSGFWDVNDN